MKKFFTLFAVLATALAASAQEPLFSFKTKVIADAEWGAEYASSFAFQGTEVTVDVYEDDYVIIRNWAGAEGCDLKVEYDSGADIDSDDCYGNIFAITAYINGEEQTPLTYTKDETDEESGETYTYQYFDFATGRADYPVCSSTMNDDGTFYWSFVEVDKENQTGYVELSYLYFLTADYSASMDEQHYYVEWPKAESDGFFGTFEAEVYDDYDESSPSFPATKGITVDAYADHVLVHGVAGIEGYDMEVRFDEEGSILSITPPAKGGVGFGDTKTSGYCSIYTGLDDANWKSFQAYLPYCSAESAEDGGYVLLYGYDYNSTIYGYYCLSWGEDDEEGDEDAIAAAKAAVAGTAVYNIAGQRVKNAAQGVYIINGKKVVLK